MGAVSSLLVAYILGGITFLPLLICSILLHAYLTFPYVPDRPVEDTYDALHDDSDDGKNIKSGKDVIDSKYHREAEKEFGGYFAVCREWIPGGINGKPPERTTPAGEVIAEESPSVYQSMYRSIFDRKQAPTMEIAKQNGRPTKRARNLFYIVLRHGHLMLYDDSEQVEVRHVISLAHHDVGVYGGEGEEIPEGELWIKRNAISLNRKVMPNSIVGGTSKPFYLFSENCSEKEDFYFALLQDQERVGNERYPAPLVQHFELKHIINLVQRLHSSEEHLQTRWINALIGRLFLSIYKTQEVENYIRTKMMKKISRVNKPAFLSGIVLKKIDAGNSAPFITNPRLKDLTVEGECTVEMDISYSGNFRIEVGTTAKIDLGTRFKAREVNLVLAITLKKLEGHLLVRFKAPPSNRVWIAFEKMPHIEMNIEPIVSSRQITYSIILRAIESRIREVLAETLVLPHWDDSPFLSTLHEHFRGGIWVNERRDFQPPTETVIPDDIVGSNVESTTAQEVASEEDRADQDAATGTMTGVNSTVATNLTSRKGKTGALVPVDGSLGSSSSIQRVATEPPRSLRSKSFASAVDPVVSTDHISSSPSRPGSTKSKDAASIMTEITNRSQPGSPTETPFGSYDSNKSIGNGRKFLDSTESPVASISEADLSSSQATLGTHGDTLFANSPASLSARSPTLPSFGGSNAKTTRLQSVTKNLTPSEKKQQSLAAAAAAAKDWGWRTLARGKAPNPTEPYDKPGTPSHPIGRGRPLPPPGQPLPLPEKRSSTSSLPLSRRKPLPPQRPNELSSGDSKAKPTPTKQNSSRREVVEDMQQSPGDGLLVVEAPLDSAPSSPLGEEGYGEFMDNVLSDEDEVHKDRYSSDEPTTQHVTNEDQQARSVDTHRRHRSDSGKPSTTSLEDDISGITTWQSAQEAEARERSVWMDEPEYQ